MNRRPEVRMTENIDTLRARSDELRPDELAETVATNEAILRLIEGDLLATRSLALALVKLGELDRADEIVQEALVLHPADDILLRRASDVASARRWAAKEASTAKGKKNPTVARVSNTWIKAVHYGEGEWTERPGDDIWLSDPGQRDAHGQRLYTAAKEPWGRPSWRVGEQAGIYFGGTHRVPVLVEITVLPVFDPVFVQAAEWAEDGAGERWPWVTWVRVLKIVDVKDAPTLDQLGIPTSSMQQRARLCTDPDIHGRLVQALDIAS
jgi:hypothetical protein